MDRSNENMKNLLDKYWAGESSLEDEKSIYAYFNSGKVSPDLKEFTLLFSYLDSEKTAKIDITSDVLEKIENLADGNHTSGIDNLLEKYWSGESSLEDEQLIRLYFNQANIADEYMALVPYFKYLKSEKNISLDVTDAVMQKISALPVSTKVIQLGWHRILSLAASLLLVISMGFAVYQYQQIKKTELTSLDTFQTPEEALEQTKAALAYLSARMNRGTDKAINGLSKTETLEIFNQ